MITGLLITLVIADLVLLGLILVLNRRQNVSSEALAELTEEREILTELRRNAQEELGIIQADCRDILQKVTHIAAETEQEFRNSSHTIAKDVEGVVGELQHKFETPLRELAKRQASLDATMRKLEREKKILQKVIMKAEKLARFFDKNITYEDLVEELEEKKYSDAMHLLAQGLSADKVAIELGMTTNEVKLLTGFAHTR